MLAIFFGCAQGPSPNVLLVVIDTLRQDALGVYGAVRDTSPELDAFAAIAIRFDRAYAAAPWTNPSASSIPTGLYPGGHTAEGADRSIGPEVQTRAEVLRECDYRTAAVVAQAWVTRRGFDTYLVEAPHPGQLSTEALTDQAIGLLEEFAGADTSFLLYVYGRRSQATPAGWWRVTPPSAEILIRRAEISEVHCVPQGGIVLTEVAGATQREVLHRTEAVEIVCRQGGALEKIALHRLVCRDAVSPS